MIEFRHHLTQILIETHPVKTRGENILAEFLFETNKIYKYFLRIPF